MNELFNSFIQLVTPFISTLNYALSFFFRDDFAFFGVPFWVIFASLTIILIIVNHFMSNE